MARLPIAMEIVITRYARLLLGGSRLALASSDLRGKMTGLWLVIESDREKSSDLLVSLQSGVALEALEWPESLLTLSVSKISWSTVLLLGRVKSLPCEVDRG